uniref:Fanconi-associated nuclease n=2 Tax=Parascaris univalens TaxID=6257 RepID=A0A915C9F9_PARUN
LKLGFFSCRLYRLIKWMALLRAFQRQLEKKKCPACGIIIPSGKYQSHINRCFIDSDDDECVMIACITAEEKKRRANEQLINLDNSSTSMNETQNDKQSTTTIAINDLNLPMKSDKNVTESFTVVKAKRLKVEDEEIVEMKNHQLKVVENNSFKGGINRMKEETNKWDVPTSTSRSMNTNGSLSNRKRPAKVKCIESSPVKPKHLVESMETRNMGTETTITNLPQMVISGKEVEKELSREQIVEKVHNFLKCCQTELSSMAKERILSMNSISNGNEDVDDNEEMISIVENSIESNIDDDSNRSPYYLTLFLKILKRVFYEQCSENSPYSPSFWGENLSIVEKFISVSEKAKQLFVKIFIRKRRWLLVERLNLSYIAQDLSPLFDELNKVGLVESGSSGLTDLSEAIHLLHAPSLKLVAKKFQININCGKLDIARKLLKLSQERNVLGQRNTTRMLQVVREYLGACYRIDENVWRFFNAVFTLYSPYDMSSSQLLDQPTINVASQFLFSLLQLATNKVRYPAPSSSPLLHIYWNQEMLLRYIIAKELEANIADAIGRAKWSDVYSGALKARHIFLDVDIEYRLACEAIPPHLRRFTDLWVYTRCISHGIEALQRQRKYKEAVDWLQHLLNNKDAKMFLMDARGSWWDRLALNLDSHLKQRDEALKAINAALEDPSLGDKDRLLLQDRGEKINDTWKGPMNVPDPERIDISGSVLGKNLGDSRTNRFIIRRDETSYECAVEEIALRYYLRNGYKEGVHAEGAIWHTVFGLLCYDIIFDHQKEDVWFCETQTNPADLNSPSLYIRRKMAFDERFDIIEESTSEELIDLIKLAYDGHYGETNSEISWDVFSEFAQLKRFILCCQPKVLTSVFRRLVKDYRNCRSGFPDLTIWNDESGKLAVAEVKGPGDKLSTKQRLWLQYFSEHGVTAHVCHVAARNSKCVDND